MMALKQTGDTIIEVMVAMSVLAVILGVSFASATRSLNQGTNANSRNAAIQYAEQQITSIQYAVQISGTGAFPSGNFCMYGTSIDTTTSDCDKPPFSVVDTFNSTTTNTFTITCTWQGLNGQNEQIQLYYHSLNTTGG